jgi:hypothetical protein
MTKTSVNCRLLTVRSLTGVCIFFTTFLTVTVAAAEELPQATLPTYSLPNECRNVHINGFTKAVILSQTDDRYSPNVNCRILISIRGPNHVIRLTFEHLDLAEPSSSGVCQDSVQLFNQGTHETALSGQLCGTRKTPMQFISNSSTVALVFVSDAYQERTGFRLQYERVEKPGAVSPQAQQGTGRSVACTPTRCNLASSSAWSTVRHISRFEVSVVLLVGVLFRFLLNC